MLAQEHYDRTKWDLRGHACAKRQRRKQGRKGYFGQVFLFDVAARTERRNCFADRLFTYTREREPEHSRKSAIGAESAGMSRSFKHAYGTARKAGKCVKNVMRGIVSVTASDIK